MRNRSATAWLFGVIMIGIMLLGVDRPVRAQYPPDLSEDIPWQPARWWIISVAEIAAAWNEARTAENEQLGSALPPLKFPSQNEWNSWSDNEKALFLINAERVDRGLLPLEGSDPTVTNVAADFAGWLLANDAWGHEQDVDGDGVAESPWDRLHDDKAIAPAAIATCHDFLGIAENLAVYVSNHPENRPAEGVARAIYDWLYADASSDWGHRHALLWDSFNDNSGIQGAEGLLGISVQTATGYQGPFSEPWPGAALIVLNVYDPCGVIEASAPSERSPSPARGLPLGQLVIGGALLLVVSGSLLLRRHRPAPP